MRSREAEKVTEAEIIDEIERSLAAALQHAMVRSAVVTDACTIVGPHSRWSGSGRCKRCGSHRDAASASG